MIYDIPENFHLQPITGEGLRGLSDQQPAEKVACSSTWSFKLLTHVCIAVDGSRKMKSAWLTELGPVGISLGLTLAADAFLQTWKAGQQPSACWPPVIQKASISPLVHYVFCLCNNSVKPRNTKTQTRQTLQLLGKSVEDVPTEPEWITTECVCDDEGQTHTFPSVTSIGMSVTWWWALQLHCSCVDGCT